MKIKQIDLNKVQVTITAMDLMTFDMDIESLKPDSPALHTFLFDIMDKIQSETTFNPNNGQIIIEASQTGEEAIMLTVTKVVKRKDVSKQEKMRRFKNAKPQIKKPKEKNYIYAITAFGDMTSLLSKLDPAVLQSGCLYAFEKQYFLSLQLAPEDACHHVLREYSSDTDTSDFADVFLREHGRIIAEKTELVSLAAGIRKYKL